MTKSLDIVVPCFSEVDVLRDSTERLHSFAREHLDTYDWRIILASNGAKAETKYMAARLAKEYDHTIHINLSNPGRGGALRWAWLGTESDICAYTDADLSLGLDALPALISSVADDGYGITTGSRYLPESRVSGRGLRRRITSEVYVFLLRVLFRVPFHDAQCGLKVIGRDAANALIPLVRNNNWFFDSELLILAHQRGYQIKEIPVVCIDTGSSTVRVINTIKEFLIGIARLKLASILRI